MGNVDVRKYSNKILFEAQGIVVYIHTMLLEICLLIFPIKNRTKEKNKIFVFKEVQSCRREY